MHRKYLTPEEIKKLTLNEHLELLIETKTPLYTPDNTKCIHCLYYDWTGWVSQKAVFPNTISEAVEYCTPLWMNDGFKIKKWNVKNDIIQILFEVKPEIAPVLLTKRVKGRLDNALRKLGTPVKFSRKVGFRCLGENTREIVNNYVMKQVSKSDYVDERFKKSLSEFTFLNKDTDLSQPFVAAHGRYWVNIHLVIVVEDRRFPITRKDNFEKIKELCFKIANKKEIEIARLSIMPDHIHITLKGNPMMSPIDIGCSFLSNLAYLLGNNRCWSSEFYVGTFSEYSVHKLI